MKIYVENRVWFLDIKLENKVDTEIICNRLTSGRSRNLCRPSSCFVSYVANPIDYYSDEKYLLQISLNANSLSLINKNIHEISNILLLKNIFIRFIDHGFINILSIFNLNDNVETLSYKSIEIEGMIISEKNTLIIINEIENILNDLYSLGALSIPNKTHFGIPKLLTQKNHHTATYNYLYNQHLFVFDGKVFNQYMIESGLLSHNNILHYEGFKKVSTWSFTFWLIDNIFDSNNENECPAYTLTSEQVIASNNQPSNKIIDIILKLLAIDSFGLCESVIYDNATACYTAFLGLVAHDEKPTSKILRDTLNLYNYILQTIRLQRRDFTVDQVHYIHEYAKLANFAHKRSLLEMAEKSIKFAVEGMEVDAARASNRKTQFLIAFFTSITLYSVFSDILTILNSPDPSLTSLVSVRSACLLLLTMLVMTFIIIFRRHI